MENNYHSEDAFKSTETHDRLWDISTIPYIVYSRLSERIPDSQKIFKERHFHVYHVCKIDVDVD